MMIEAGLILSRFLHFAAVLVLFGASLFPLYAWPDRADETSARSERFVRKLVLSSAAIALLSSIPWLAFTAANMAGDMSAAVDWDAVGSILRETGFGYRWLARAALALLILVGLKGVRRNSAHARIVLVLAAALLLASLAGVGHTQQTEGTAGALHVSSDALHLLAAGAWLGGLIVLAYALTSSAQDAEPVLKRFSGMGYVAVATLVASGLINGWYLVGSIEGLFDTAYGRLLLVKLCLFAGMLALAIANRFWLTPALTVGGKAGRRSALIRLRHHVIAEETLGLLVILAVSVLGTMEPAVSQMSQ